jgi:hypothetical protein
MAKVLRLVTLIAVVLTACSCTDDVLDASYPSQADAVAAGAVKRGWIPSWIPSDATQLREVHNVDTNQSALLFNLPPGSTWHPPSDCQPAVAGQFSAPAFDRDWIPDIESGYALYTCPAGLAGAPVQLFSGVAVHESGQHVFHWRVLAR